MPELSGLRLLRVDEGRAKAILTKTDPLSDSATWTPINQLADAVGVLLDGVVKLDGPSTGGIEVVARAAAAARGRFDDPERGRSRDDRLRGLWPKGAGRSIVLPRRLFGFTTKPDGLVELEKEVVTVLRVDGASPSESELGLLDVQRRALDTENGKPAVPCGPQPEEQQADVLPARAREAPRDRRRGDGAPFRPAADTLR